ncbi:MAG: AMP-binding protein [Pseudomonadota bacterium]
MSDPSLPLMPQPPSEAPFIRRRDGVVSQRQFMHRARALAGQLPEGEYAVNLCEDRYHFLLAFVALLLRGKVNLLPANRSPAEVQSVASRYGECHAIVDRELPDLGLPQLAIDGDFEAAPQGEEKVPLLPAQQRCAVVFTSGSTGQSQPWEKRWGELYHGAWLTRQMLQLEQTNLSVVATVPSQHMYGLETTVLLPLVTGMVVDAGRPFFPHDLQQALEATPAPRLLVTTPVHLKACLAAGIASWPQPAQIISATAPLAPTLAAEAEQAFGCPLHEIYGSTETGAIATRRTREEGLWTLHRGVQMEVASSGEGCATVYGGHLRGSVVLNDRVEPETEGRFRLLGRSADMLKIAGKRVSLGDLNHKLLAIPGVEDGLFIPPAESGADVLRLSAVVVAPGLTRKAVLAALKQQLDPLCLPRPLHMVERLPRNEAGKLPRQALERLLATLGRSADG